MLYYTWVIEAGWPACLEHSGPQAHTRLSVFFEKLPGCCNIDATSCCTEKYRGIFWMSCTCTYIKTALAEQCHCFNRSTSVWPPSARRRVAVPSRRRHGGSGAAPAAPRPRRHAPRPEHAVPSEEGGRAEAGAPRRAVHRAARRDSERKRERVRERRRERERE